MKKIIVALLAFVVVATGVIFAIGQQKAGGGHGKMGKRGGHHRGAGMAFRGLDLTEDQKTKVKEIRQASRENTKAIREELKAAREKMRSLTADGAFDEAQITAAANEQASASAKLIVERQKVRSQVFTLLTDE